MDKELLIIVYKIGANGQSRQQLDETVKHIKENMVDEELGEKYIIKQIFIPVLNENSDVKIIYPIPRYTTSPEINDLVTEISNKIKDDTDGTLKQQWKMLERELKIRKIGNYE